MTRYALIVLILAGCAMTPQELMEQGTQSEHVLKGSTAESSSCVARNVENHRGVFGLAFVPTVRPLGAGMEVIVRAAAAEQSVISIVHITPAEQGFSVARIWRATYPIMQGSDNMLAAMIKGC